MPDFGGTPEIFSPKNYLLAPPFVFEPFRPMSRAHEQLPKSVKIFFKIAFSQQKKNSANLLLFSYITYDYYRIF
jgi:hypothetical protein